VAWLRANSADPFVGGHDPEAFSLDLLAPFIYGEHWPFSALTEGYWSDIDLKLTEASVHLGGSVLALVALVAVVTRRLRVPGLGSWYVMLAFFAVMSLGPTLRVWGNEVSAVPMPYPLLERIIPGLSLSGVPARMILMTILAAAVISAVGVGWLMRAGNAGRLAAVALALVLVVEYLPEDPRVEDAPIFVSDIAIPQYVSELRDLPEGGSVLDLTSRGDLDLYYQTVHGKPLAVGKLSRLPTSAFILQAAVQSAVARGAYRTLSDDLGVRYLVTDSPICSEPTGPCLGVRLVFDGGNRRFYDLGGTG
jgi:hypothetical protein